MTQPLETILDRETHASNARETFGDQLRVLRELVNYGTQLIIRCHETARPTRPADTIILGGMAKAAIQHLDGVEILLSAGATLESRVSLRALWESFLYIDWVLKHDSERRARQYYVAYLRRQRNWNQKMVPGSFERAEFEPVLSKRFPDILSTLDAKPEVLKSAQNDIAEVDRLLEQPKYRDINEEFDRLRKKLSHEAHWYAPFNGPRSIRQLAIKLGREDEYAVLYSVLSTAAHSGGFSDHVTFDGATATFEPIRHFEFMRDALMLAYQLGLQLYGRLLKHYRDGELDALSRKYQQEWRAVMTSIPMVTYQTHPISRP